MARSTKKRPASQQKKRGEHRSSFDSILTLAKWQLHTTWRLLLVIGLGLLAAVVLVCAIPLYTQVALSAGIGHALEQDPQDRYLTVHAQSPLFSSNALQAASSGIASTMQSDLGNDINSPGVFSIQISPLNLTALNSLDVVGMDVDQAKNHLTLLQGRLPANTSGDTVEFVATAQEARDLHLQLNKSFTLAYPLRNPSTSLLPPGAKLPFAQVKFRLVGIVASIDANVLFWHGANLEPEITAKDLGVILETLPILASNDQMVSMLDQVSSAAIEQSRDLPKGHGLQLASIPDLYWYYDLNSANFSIDHLPDLISNVNAALDALSNNPVVPGFIVGTTASGSLNALQDYTSRVSLVELPASALTYLVAGLLLFFVLVMSDVLVERQVEAIAVLRSRGASAFQVFGALVGQGLGLGVIAFVAGPLLAILGVIGLAFVLLDASERGSLHLITDNLIQVAQGQLNRDLIVVGIALLGLIFAIGRVLWSNVLILRRESARATRRPFWMRLKLDLLAVAVALVGFGFEQYLQTPGVLDSQSQALVPSATSLVGSLFLLLACLLLFLRIFPATLRLIERIAVRNRRAAPMLALAQIARTPRQVQRLTLLFALASAFALFTLLFAQAQTQRLGDIVDFQVGSDFSGGIPSTLVNDSWNQQLAYFRGIKGVTSVTLGGSDAIGSVSITAVDASTYAQTTIWTAQDGSQSLSALMDELVAARAKVAKTHIVPIIIDDAAAQALGVGVGQPVSIGNFANGGHLQVIAVVHYLPTIYDTTNSTVSDSFISSGGALVDFQSYNTFLQSEKEDPISIANVWLRTSNQPADLAHVRAALLNGDYALINGEDQRALLQNLSTDPLYGTLMGILVLGALVALLLGLVGNLLVSWWNARSRRTSFAVLRALGSAPGQIASVLLWEQGIIYGVGLLLGLLLSIIFSLIILPLFVFSPVILGGIGSRTLVAFYVTQSVPGVAIPFVSWPTLGVVVGVVFTCLLSLILMVRVVVGPQIGQSLRLDED